MAGTFFTDSNTVYRSSYEEAQALEKIASFLEARAHNRRTSFISVCVAVQFILFFLLFVAWNFLPTHSRKPFDPDTHYCVSDEGMFPAHPCNIQALDL